ncbi:MAG TPA: D-alanyl-D-alanine carboxypeptidase/D-alanyl-D-alanine-endopeptidase, partial [Flavisolibacter sp.]|nr:D-alanyl-D-alanine carboxypeptidase/D-alanyl-D-alanine-endopeptidase [Flavisolibacter sp.]
EKNAAIGMAPASTQKIITAASAYELLGKDFRYQTEFGYTGSIENGLLKGLLMIRPAGDPTLGSWRWEQTQVSKVVQRLTKAIQNRGIQQYAGIVIDQTYWDAESIPDGWIWQDIGNYYGAGAAGLNWRENQFDVTLKSAKALGSEVEIVITNPRLYHYKLYSNVNAAGKGTGDNAYIYFPLESEYGVIRGTIPVDENQFTISGAIPSPKKQFAATLQDSLHYMKIMNIAKEQDPVQTARMTYDTRFTLLHTEVSPPLDSIIFWFNRRSINLYGEALIKTFAFRKKKQGFTDVGVQLVKDFWKEKGIPATELNIVDGSGLSPLNRVTTRAQVNVLQYAKKQSWYAGFYHSLPEFNGMKMKSGTIRGVKGYCGYHKAKDGNEYIFSFLVNNYNGSASGLVQKMYKVLDELK